MLNVGYEIRVEVDELTERSLNELADRLNVEARVLGGELIRQGVLPKKLSPRKKTSPEEMAHYWRIVAEVEAISRNAGVPILPDEALTREALYADHD